ncbi:MAG: elongation factor G [Kiloniellales bacterium]|nr:elongation factor G [Kiloniellales bacterium]
MSSDKPAGPRCAVLLGPPTSGKTTLMEAMLFQAGAIHRKGSVLQGNTVGDASPEARERATTVEPNFAHFSYLDETWFLIDCPGSVELMRDRDTSLMAADIAVVVAPPETERALALGPIFKVLDDYKIPHIIFINKLDKPGARVRDVLEALQQVSARPLVLRQVPIRESDEVTGFVDLVSERAWKYKENEQSEMIALPDSIQEREEQARQELLESLSDFDDALLEQLLEDNVPATEEFYNYLTKFLSQDKIVPVLIGSAEQGNGVTRLLKILRHETPSVAETAQRLGAPQTGGFCASVIRTVHAAHTGKLSISRIWSGGIKDGASIGDERVSGIFTIMGGENQKVAEAHEGELVALGRMDSLGTGDLLTENGISKESGMIWPETPTPVYSLAIAPLNRQDDVKLTSSVGKLIEEDSSLMLEHDEDTHEMLLKGQGEIHLKIAMERLKSKYNVEVTSSRPRTAYKETISKKTIQHSRYKRQSRGHGQFGDVHVEIKPLPRGSGFEFIDEVVGGSVPRQYIPSVEAGARDYLGQGPLGFPVVDISVKLFDGQHHSVDSSDQAFRTAGRLAMSEGMPNCRPILLEPIYEVAIGVPQEFTNKIHSLVSGRRGQILGFQSLPGWKDWDELKCQMPQAELQDLIIELRSLTLGVGSFTAQFDHLQELSGRLADQVISERQESVSAPRG